MDNDQKDETIKEILKEDRTKMKNGRKKKSCLVRSLIFIILLAVVFFGFIYIQQYLIDLEAEAIVRAAQTATALANEPSIKNNPVSNETQVVQDAPTETPTPDPAILRTVTIAAQLTSVAEFQKTATNTP
ncbi:MAG: hypothetical protein J7K66_01585 [Anaerolineaceae bacterium]|nr:hypothetical protein [Anaerolineaceae bacterium]